LESVIARVLKDPKQSIKGMRLLRFARNDRGRSVKRGYAELSPYLTFYLTFLYLDVQNLLTEGSNIRVFKLDRKGVKIDKIFSL